MPASVDITCVCEDPTDATRHICPARPTAEMVVFGPVSARRQPMWILLIPMPSQIAIPIATAITKIQPAMRIFRCIAPLQAGANATQATVPGSAWSRAIRGTKCTARLHAKRPSGNAGRRDTGRAGAWPDRLQAARIGHPGVAVRGLRKGVGGQPASVRCSYLLAKLAEEFN